MPWVLTLGKSTQPPEFQMSKWVDWEKRLKEAADRAEISNVFRKGGRKLDPAEVPKVIEVEAALFDLPPVFTTFANAMIVSDRVKTLIDAQSPGENQLIPIEVVSEKPGDDTRSWYLLNVIAEKKSIIREKSSVRPHFAYKDSWKVAYIDHQAPDRKLRLTSDALKGPHLWREAEYTSSLLMSDELKAAFDEEGIDLYDTWRADIVD